MDKKALIFRTYRAIAALIIAAAAIVSPAAGAYAKGDEPEVAAHGAVLMDAETGRVLWSHNAETPLAMASTTKIMTAVLALESGRTEEIVTVSKKAAAAPEVKLHLHSGEKLRLYDLLQALMLESSNDAAVAIAEHLGGSVTGFCAAMTEKAAAIGAKDTLFETPNGLDAGDHHSTAYDMALIARYALRVPGFIELTNTPSASFASDRSHYSVSNRNRLLHEYTGANGVKTGFTGKAGHCFVGAAKRGDMQLISVVLASGWGNRGKAQKWTDTKALLNYGFDHFAYETLITEGDTAGTVPVTRSRSVSVDYVYGSGLRLPLNQQNKEPVAVEKQVPASIPAPIRQGETVGTAWVSVSGASYGDIRLIAVHSAERHDLKTSLEKVLDAWLGQGTSQEVKVTLPEFADPIMNIRGK